MKKLAFASLFTVGLVLSVAAPAFAHDCVNLSRNINSVGVVVGPGCNPDGTDSITVISNGVAQRVDKFGLNPDGTPNFNFHGPLGLDFNCDGTPDLATYEPGGGTGGVVQGAVHGQGQNRVNCKGVTDIEDAFADGCIAA
jgi:hypothetical protein